MIAFFFHVFKRKLLIFHIEEIALAATKSLEDQLRQCITTVREQRTSIDYWFGASTHRNTKSMKPTRYCSVGSFC